MADPDLQIRGGGGGGGGRHPDPEKRRGSLKKIFSVHRVYTVTLLDDEVVNV